METNNKENKNLGVLGNNQVSSANIEQQKENLALPEIGNNATMTEADLQQQEDQRTINKFALEQLGYSDLNQPLSTTVFDDENVKMPLFLASLLTFTAEEQRNIVLTGESSVGKTLNIRECFWYFRHENSDTIFEINDATPRALIFSPNSIPVDDRTIIPIDLSKEPQKGDAKEVWDEWYEQKRHTAYYLDLSNKIVVLYDLKNYDLLQNLRSLLSHDNKICSYLITDKSPNGGAFLC